MLRQAVFLVGGLGTRLKELTRVTPKPLIEVAGRPFIDYLIDEAARHGFSDIVLLAGYLGGQFEAHYDGLRRHGATVRVLTEPEPLGTGGALRFALPQLEPRFLLANGDSFFDFNLRALRAPPALGATMALRATAPGDRYGTVELREGRVRSFQSAGGRRDAPINAGIYLLDREVAAAVPPRKVSLEQDLFPRLATEGRILGDVFDGFFIDMGVPEDLALAQREMATRTRRPAVFFDRDGVLNVDHGYVHRPEQWQWMPGAREAIRLCNDRGWLVFVVTNQAGVAHGYYDEAAVVALHGWVSGELAAAGAHVDAFEYCPHHPDGRVEAYRRACRRRKPGPGMIEDLLSRWPVDVARSWLVGDKDSDLEAARAAGIGAVAHAGGDLLRLVADELAARGAG